jgi:uncharacterized membrane protein YphA (DoxX/SURF4 family)
VYVLDPTTVERVMGAAQPNPFLAYYGNEFLFYFWGTVTFVLFSTVLAVSWFRMFEKRLDPVLFALKKYALPLARVTVGLCFVAFALSGNLYGSELFLSKGYGDAAPLMGAAIFMIGVLASIGLWTRVAGLGMLAVYTSALMVYGVYILTYTDFLGAAALITILGGGKFSIDDILGHEPFHELSKWIQGLRPYAFAILRICFGWGVLYASVYAKFVHSGLALQVVNQYDLTRFFPFDPLFVVLGALIIEFIAGLMIVFGVALRWTLLFLAFWLTLSLLYFQELIWPHAILFGLAIALFLHGYDKYSLEGYVMKKKGKEPVF